jgi:hypothetical protein
VRARSRTNFISCRFSASVHVFGFVAAGTGGFIAVPRFNGY